VRISLDVMGRERRERKESESEQGEEISYSSSSCPMLPIMFVYWPKGEVNVAGRLYP